MKILFVGASGFGNLGDDAYKEIFSEHLKYHELMFDSPYPDLRCVDWCDILIIGGGGLVYCNNTDHFKYMKMYMDRAMNQKKTILLISVGVQFVSKLKDRIKEVLTPWKPYLDYAKAITVRSPSDKEILESITNTKVNYYPDLCYLIKPVDYHLTLPNSVVFTMTTLAFNQGDLQQQYEKYKARNRYFVIMSNDDKNITESFIRQKVCNYNYELTGHYFNRDNLHPREAARIFADADIVVSSRYHSMVFSRAVGCKNIINVDPRYKSQVEPKEYNKNDAINHIKTIKKYLKKR